MRAPRYQGGMHSPLGPIGVRTLRGRLTGVEFLESGVALPAAPADAVAARALAALEAYFAGSGLERALAGLPLGPAGTPFQHRVWASLSAIPWGEIRLYGELARLLGSAARAVGGACRRNPLAILVPCHRVVSATGLGGYAGALAGPVLERKRWLLRHEGYPG